MQCPLPLADYPRVTLAHGGGGRLGRQLVDELFAPAFGSALVGSRHDGARLADLRPPLAFTTDAHVVRPLFFPGGDIGRLAIVGTVNDLAMCGARPRHVSLSFVLEEGLSMETLWRVACSIGEAARETGVAIAAGDTKVVEQGHGDGIYISTAGIGEIVAAGPIGPDRVRAGDAILVSGDLGRHGIAVLTRREGFTLEAGVDSDCAPLWGPVAELLEAGVEVRCLRDLTRGGLASALVEIAEDGGVELEIDEAAIPVSQPVRAACEVLGLDPLLVANEGRFVAFVPPEEAARACAVLRAHPLGTGAAVVGQVSTQAPRGRAWIRGMFGQVRALAMPSGEQLPRIC
jgi:hydrogenase expression/formation protein HypE